jgi:hypothetical protein
VAEGCSPHPGDDGGLDVQRLQRGLIKLVEQVHSAGEPGQTGGLSHASGCMRRTSGARCATCPERGSLPQQQITHLRTRGQAGGKQDSLLKST